MIVVIQDFQLPTIAEISIGLDSSGFLLQFLLARGSYLLRRGSYGGVVLTSGKPATHWHMGIGISIGIGMVLVWSCI